MAGVGGRVTTIRVFYSCPACGVEGVAVDVGARKPGEDVVDWMDSTIKTLGLHHELRKPETCAQTSLKEVKIPLSKREGAGIGEV